MLLPNIHLHYLFLKKKHPFTLLLLINFALNSSVPGIGFSFFEKRSLPYRVFFFFKGPIDFETSRKSNTVENQPELAEWVLMVKTMHFLCGNKIYHKMGV